MSGDDTEADSLTIVSITPRTAVAGVPTEFVVEVEYKLSSTEQGDIDLGFNSLEFVTYRLVTEEIVDAGEGSVTLSATVTPVDWGSTGDFGALVALSEHPHPETWTPLKVETIAVPVTTLRAHTQSQPNIVFGSDCFAFEPNTFCTNFSPK